MAADTGIVFTTISNLETGKQRITYNMITRIMEAYPDDFVTLTPGQKIDLIEKLEKGMITDIPASLYASGITDDYTTAAVYTKGEEPNLILFVRNQNVNIFVEKIQLNAPLVNPEFYNVVAAVKDPSACIVFEMAGRSMAELIQDRALLLAETRPLTELEYIENGIFAFVYRNNLIIRRVKENNPADLFITLYANNPDFGPIYAQRADIKAVWRVLKIVSQDLT